MRTNIFISILALLSGLSISLVAIYYSVSGLVSIFSGAATSIIIMGSTLEISKLVATVWLKRFWNVVPTIIKTYLISAIIILMLITSLGIYGFLARAAEQQHASIGDIEDKLLIIDDKIKIQEDIILNSKKSLEQLNSAVDQVMGRSETEKGAVKSVKIRQSQKEERLELQKNIHDAQDQITLLKQERSPISIQSRKSSVEYGPIKHLAGLLFNDSSNNLDNAVRYVIILIVIVFDPLAVILLLCSQYSFSYIKNQNDAITIPTVPEEESGIINEPDNTINELSIPQEEIIEEELPNIQEEIIEEELPNIQEEIIEEELQEITELDSIEENLTLNEKIAKNKWKKDNNNDTIKHQEKLFNLGLIDKLPWDNI